MDHDSFFDTCEKCGKEHVHSHKYSLPICVECREEMLKRPVSKKVTLFLFAIVVFSVMMLYRLPDAMTAAVEYEKGMNALEVGKNVTALENFEKVKAYYPKSIAVLSALYEALYKNERVDEAFEVLDQMIAIDDEPAEDVADKVNLITDKINLYYYPSDAFYDLMDGLENADFYETYETVEQYVTQNPNDIMAAYVLCDYYFELEEYSKIESLLEPLCVKYPDWKMGLYTLVPAKRELLKIEEAQKYYKILIALNTEDVGSYTIAAKAELKFKNDEKALELAQTALALAPENPYVQGTLAMAYHFNSDETQSRYYLELFNNSDSIDDDTYEFVNSMVADESNWR